MKQFRIAAVQAKRDPYNEQRNTKDGLAFVHEAKSKGADMVLFPECWITGYEFPDLNKPYADLKDDPSFIKWCEGALTEKSPHVQAFCDLAKELQIAVVITGYTKGEKAPRNSAFVINRAGEIAYQYDKVHTCDFGDEKMLESGDSFHVYNVDGVQIGIMICYDREYPESARILMLKGAELILVPNDCETMAPRVQALSTRAYENMTGIVMANPPRENAGFSCAFSPICWDENGKAMDNTVMMADETSEGLFMAEFDLDKLRNYRKKEMMGNTFRKVKAYGELLKEAVEEPFVRDKESMD